MKASRVLGGVVAALGLSASAFACMQGPEEAKTSSEPVQVCFTDAACVDIPDAGLPPWPDVGVPPPPAFPDAGFPSAFDAAWPPSYGFDAGLAPLCNAFDPKYYAEYVQALGTWPVVPCFACAANQCCYQGLACVAQ